VGTQLKQKREKGRREKLQKKRITKSPGVTSISAGKEGKET